MILTGIVGGTKRSESGQELIASKIRIPVGILGVLIIMFIGFFYGAIKPVGQLERVSVGDKLKITYPIEKTQVISPLANDKVECRILTMGVYPEIHLRIIIILSPLETGPE